MSETTVFIYCDNQEHSGRRYPIDEFRRRNAGLFGGWVWDEQGDHGRYSGTSIVADGAEVPGWANDPTIPNSAHRNRFLFTCKGCGASIPAREERLTAVLDRLADIGDGSVSLGDLSDRLSGTDKHTR